MDKCLINDTRPASLEAVRDMRQLLQRVLTQQLQHPQQLQRMLLCFSELATNIVRHSAPPARAIGVQLWLSNHQWQIHITDDGGSWQACDIVPLDEHEVSATGGRGLSLITHYCDNYQYIAGKLNLSKLQWPRVFSQNKPHVLIVEDDSSQQRLLRAYLKDEYQVDCVSDGEQALALLDRLPIDLILSDVNMPKMNGLTLRERLNQAGNRRLIPFIFITQDTKRTSMNYSLGFDDLLTKPVTKSQLLQTITRVLSRSAQVYTSVNEHINQQISRSLLPNLPSHFQDWSLGYASRSAGSGGGDFVLCQRHDCVKDEAKDEALSVLLVDIMEHNIEAKFFSYAYAGYMRGLLSHKQQASPSALLAAISNAAYQDSMLSQTLMTCCACTLFANHTLLFSCAGHPPPLLITESELIPIPSQGTLPGLIADIHFSEHKLQLHQGQRVALYTDGLFESGGSIERRQSLETIIKKRLVDTLSMDIQAAAESCMQTFDRHGGVPARDDALLLLIEPNSGVTKNVN
ncbi:response regulator [Shewanella sp. SNU WT4]|uniref:SpoIIE family protein phosphatase n=1 Tax=Shewanella sp. SNU WT4 TaxID=2590015 RepID=UPI00112EA689|nr:SpoIIE family protein phosphatase [Shewanella sp. SNU WT4]QDF68133.1 response regulator [Shewanella sp. SNU WT4]